MEELLDGQDFDIVSEGLREISGSMDVWVIIKRVTGLTGGTFAGKGQVPTVSEFDVPGTVEDVTQEEIVHSGGMLSMGNIKLTTTIDINQKDEVTPQQGDVLVYGGLEWHLVGIPFRVAISGGDAAVKSFWRRT